MEYVDGKKQNQAKPKLRVKLDQWVEVTVDVTANSIVTSIKQEGNNFPQIDKFAEPKTNLSQGNFGFRVPGKDKLAVGNFSFAPK
jgi:multidrug efflux pump subunit AcrB